jgi:ABC-type phosphate transport system ATPase subunit
VPEARRISDFLAFMYEGRVVEYGETAQLFDQPREQATRDYLAGGLVTIQATDNGVDDVPGAR